LFSPLFLGSDQASCYLKKALKKYWWEIPNKKLRIEI
jgi:hypothetical protein